METDTGFDLENAIANWLDELASQPGLSDDNLRELESHLREVIAVQLGEGATEAAAFATAVANIGNSTQMVQEFAKENVALIWRRRIFWMALAALTLPALLGLPFMLLNNSTRLLTTWGYGPEAGEWQQTLFLPAIVIAGPALVVGFLRLLARGERLPVSDSISWLMSNPLRLFLIVTLPVVLYLAAYVMTNHANLVWSWLKFVGYGLSLSLLFGFLALPGRSKGDWPRVCLSWLIASRVRLASVVLLIMAPSIFSRTAYLFHADESGRRAFFLGLVDFDASILTLKLILAVSVIALQPSVAAGRKLNCEHSSKGIAYRPATNNSLWQQRVRWMCAGCLCLWAWGVLDFGLHELMARGIDQAWFRAAISVSIPFLLSVWLRRSIKTRRNLDRLNGWTNVLTRNRLILTVAIIFAGLQLGFSCLRVVSFGNLWVTGADHAWDVFRIWLMELIWPTAMLGFFLWLKAHSGGKAVAAELKPH